LCDRAKWQTVDSKHSEKLPPSSDPIFPFTSSPADANPAVASTAPSFDFGVPSKLLAPPFEPPSKRHLSEPLTSARRVGVSGIIPALDDEDDLPDVTDLLAAEDKKQKAKQLVEIKRLALANQKAHIVSDDDDDLVVESDMHAVANEEAGERRVRHAKHIRPSEGRKRQLMLGGIGSSKADKGYQEGLARTKRIPLDLLKESAKPAFQSGAKHGKDGTAGLTPAELNRLVMGRAEMDRAAINKQKEDEWMKRGGKIIKDVEVAEVKETDGWSAILERGGKDRGRAQMEVDEDEASRSDEDWVPQLRGSASPEPEEAGSGDDDGIASEAEVAMDVLTDRDDDAEDDGENSRPRRPRRVAPHRAVLDSDEDDDAGTENVRPLQSNLSIGQILVPDTSFAENTLPLIRMPGMIHRGSLSSFDEPTEDENDKENNTQLMFDKSEDKENKAVVRHSPPPVRPALGPRGGSLFGLEDRTRRALSMSPSAVELSDDDHRRADDESDRPRSPLKELRDEDDPFAFSPSFTTRLQRPTLSGLAPPSPVIGNHGTIGFSQFHGEDSEHAADIAKSGLQPGFSDIFKSSPSVVPFKPSDSGGFSQWPEDQVCVLLYQTYNLWLTTRRTIRGSIN
jgi:mediator of replication checkpoint protein 1